MNAIVDAPADPLTEWLLHARPVGLVIGPNIIREEELTPPRQGAVETSAVAALISDGSDEDAPVLADPWAFFETVLRWKARFVPGVPGGPELPETLAVKVPEHDVTLTPDWAVLDLGDAGGYQLLVKLHLHADADQRGALEGWEASPQQQFERLLRESGIPIGVLVDRAHLRIVYAPRGETSGWIAFPLRSLATVAGRAMLGGLKLMLGHARLFTEPEQRRLPKLLARSREAQNAVSTKLAEQVLGTLHELLRAFHAADPARIEHLAATRPQHLYEGLLTTLLRLVFLLYAEDRDLIPTTRTGEAVEIYEEGYSVRGLYARLAEDRALHPDTMDERVGGWGRLLALFRLVHAGHPSGWITPRGGKLFDRQAFPFLEGRDDSDPPDAAKVLPIRDGAILRILEGLMTIEARTLTGDRVRERLSYRALDVEQIGSVYETVMGFTVLRASGPMLALKGEKNLPVFVEIEALNSKKGADRQKHLKELGGAPTGKKLEAIKKASGVEEITAALTAVVDERGSPGGNPALAGAPVLQPTDERRRTGSHYTPRSLTEPIVRHALEPAFKRIGEDATPDQVLDIKVCDLACGSGAFLVEACRQLGEQLEKAWAIHKELKPKIPADEDDALHARRLVAQRCLYGVDKNPLAVDLARLSLWLATLAREHEFTFLDHALKCGDSLIGLTREQIEAAHWDLSKNDAPLLRGILRDRINEVATGRREIQFAPDDVQRAIQEARHRVVETRLEQPRLYGDAVVAAFFSSDKPRTRETKRSEVESLLAGIGAARDRGEKLVEIAATLRQGEHPIRPFHWEIEFPEVFARDNPGFDAIVGNPPFAGKNTTIAANRAGFSDWLKAIHADSHGNADLVAHFFRRSFKLVRKSGAFGLIATNTISQGDTRTTGLLGVIQAGGSISRAVKRLQWPGTAAVVVSVVHAIDGAAACAVLNGHRVSRISTYLVEGNMDGSPPRLAANAKRAFKGSEMQGFGFVFSAQPKGEENDIRVAEQLLKDVPGMQERIRPIINGDDIVTSVAQLSSRFAFNLSDLTFDEALERYPMLVKIAEVRVKPEREKLGGGADALRRRINWWRWSRSSPSLYEAMKASRFVLGAGYTSPHLSFRPVPSDAFYLNTAVLITNGAFGLLSIVQSRVHEIWARFFSSSMKDDLRYAPSDCFETFPFPPGFETVPALEAVGQAYHHHRAALMVARNEGMTKTYNRFHDANERSADIERLRELHAGLDRVVLSAYGWDDLADRARPEFLTEENEDNHTYQGRLFWPSDLRDEVLARLLRLNAERHAEEVRLGLVRPGATRAPDEQGEDEAQD